MKPAPNFTLQDQSGKEVSLTDYTGKWLIVYFYPKDDTPGCTTEACSFRDEYSYLQEKGLSVVGISKDSVKSHAKFADKYKLNFPLLSDPEHEVIEAYGSWGPKKFMGREFLGTHRNTYLIDPKGQIVKEYEGVTPKEHVGQIMKDFSTLES